MKKESVRRREEDSYLLEAGRRCSERSTRQGRASEGDADSDSDDDDDDGGDDSAAGATLPSRSPSMSGHRRPLRRRCLLLLLLHHPRRPRLHLRLRWRCSSTSCCSETPRRTMSPRKTLWHADTTPWETSSPPFSSFSIRPSFTLSSRSSFPFFFSFFHAIPATTTPSPSETTESRERGDACEATVCTCVCVCACVYVQFRWISIRASWP